MSLAWNILVLFMRILHKAVQDVSQSGATKPVKSWSPSEHDEDEAGLGDSGKSIDWGQATDGKAGTVLWLPRVSRLDTVSHVQRRSHRDCVNSKMGQFFFLSYVQQKQQRQIIYIVKVVPMNMYFVYVIQVSGIRNPWSPNVGKAHFSKFLLYSICVTINVVTNRTTW